MRFINIFLPGPSEKLDAATLRRLPYLAGMNFLLIAFFFLSAFIRYEGDPPAYRAFFSCICGSEAFFVLSLALLKSGRPGAASYVGTSGILVNVMFMAFLTPFTAWNDIYKLGVYLIGAVVANALVSLGRRQLVVYMAASFAVYASIVFLVAAPGLGGMGPEGRLVAALFLVLFATVNVIVLLMHDINRGLVDLAEAEGAENRSRAEGLRALIGSVSKALETGRELVAAAGEGKGRSSEIRGRLAILSGEARELESESISMDAESVAALERMTAARAAVDDQNVVIVDAGAAVERMGQTIREIISMAGERRRSIAEVSALAERQGAEIRDLLGGVERIREASEAVMAAVGGILDVSEKTQLLAMNASIEAAHAGASGKGFAVIAGEIRKLSRETQESTRRIGEAIKANDSTIGAQASSIGRFSEGMNAVTGGVKSTFEALGGMMNALGRIDGATSNLSESTLSMLRLAGETKTAVLGVVEGLESGAQSADAAKLFASRFAAELAAMLGAFDALDAAVEKAASIGERNLARVAELDSALAGVELGPRG
jgi:methyl-accepting chemotaxis protein